MRALLVNLVGRATLALWLLNILKFLTILQSSCPCQWHRAKMLQQHGGESRAASWVIQVAALFSGRAS